MASITFNNEQIRFLKKIQKLRWEDKLNTGYNRFIERRLKEGFYYKSDRLEFDFIIEYYKAYMKTGNTRFSINDSMKYSKRWPS